MEYKYYPYGSEEYKKLFELWQRVAIKMVNWEEFLFTAEKIKQANE